MLNNITRTLNNTTIQLTIASVDWMDRGTYICKQIQAKSVLPSGVFVEVGGKFFKFLSLVSEG